MAKYDHSGRSFIFQVFLVYVYTNTHSTKYYIYTLYIEKLKNSNQKQVIT